MKLSQLKHKKMEKWTNLPPSAYAWLLPSHDPGHLQRLVDEDKFPSSRGLLPALGYCIFFGVARVVLTALVFKVRITSNMSSSCINVIYFIIYSFQPLGRWAMKLNVNKSFERNAKLDAQIKKAGRKKLAVNILFEISLKCCFDLYFDK